MYRFWDNEYEYMIWQIVSNLDYIHARSRSLAHPTYRCRIHALLSALLVSVGGHQHD